MAFAATRCVVALLLITECAAMLNTSVAAPSSKFLSSQDKPKKSESVVEAEQSEHTAESMEKALTDLMLGNSALGATPMGQSVKKIADIMSKTMMPAVIAAHKTDQKHLNEAAEAIKKCGSVKDSAFKTAKPANVEYAKMSKLHKPCRNNQAVKYTSAKTCSEEEKALKKEAELKCKQFSTLAEKFGTQKANNEVVKKAGGESDEGYITRISTTICGKHVHGTKGNKKDKGGWGGGLAGGYLDQYLRAKFACEEAKKRHAAKVKECKGKWDAYHVHKSKCNQYQQTMDVESCKYAVMVSDACEAYAGCYNTKKQAYLDMKADVQMDERDRKAEWRGLKRMECLIKGFADGKITNAEVDTCKKKSHSTGLLTIKYPAIPKLAKCALVTLYPTTGAYKRKEIEPLPTLAKGLAPAPCTGMVTISTTPAKGSPKGAKGERVALTGFYSAGGLVKITGGFDVSKSSQKNSCPAGTKLFAPASRADWKTFLESTKPLRAPNFIVDVTSPEHGCALCSGSAMNSGSKGRKGWTSTDLAPWWLRSTGYVKPNGKYDANCYLDVHTPNSEDSITFSENRCNYHSKSYYCQPLKIDLQPNSGSPTSCKCTKIDLTSEYSAGLLVKCSECTTVYKSTQKNSCPTGMKIFSPSTRADWKTFLSSATPLRAPNWIVDVTRPQNGCGGCSRFAMKSTTAQQATWKTSDASPWWLRSTTFHEPNGDYKANCYLALSGHPKSADTIQFNDWNCNYKSRSYYCQPTKSSPHYGGHHRRRRAPPPPTPKPRPRPVPKPRKGSTIKGYGGWEFAKVPTSDTSDKGIIAACKKAGMKVPCAGSDSCRYTNKAQCVVTSEVGCGNPMMTTAKQSGCTYPRGCPAFKNVYTYMGSKWVTKDGQKAGCGTDGSRWCTQGSPKKAGYAFCAKSTSKSKQKKNGDELGSHGGWTFYKVPTKDTSDAGTMKACKDAGLEVPCAGQPGCHYNNKAKECVQTSEVGCGNPMSTTSKSVCKGKWPRDCKAFDNTYTFMGKVWAGGGSCGTKGGSWCTVGKKNSAGFAFCAQQTR